MPGSGGISIYALDFGAKEWATSRQRFFVMTGWIRVATESSYITPETVAEATRALSGRSFTVLAGGTDFFPALRPGTAPSDLLDVRKVGEMKGISQTGDGWRIGGSTTWTEILQCNLPPCFQALKEAAREVGSLQIQNSGTVAGNICNASPAADGVPPLLAMDAVVETASIEGRRLVPLGEFITGVRKIDLPRNSLVIAVHVPGGDERAGSAFEKLGSRKYLVISIAMVAALVKLDREGLIALARVAVGACSPVARRLVALERSLLGKSVPDLHKADFVMPEQLEELTPIGDIRSSAEYRLDAAREICQRAIIRACARSKAC